MSVRSCTWKVQNGCFYWVFLPFLHQYITCMEQEGVFWRILRSFKLPLVLFVLLSIFSEAFEADPRRLGLPVKEAGLVYFLATHHRCGCRVVCCALVLLKHPIKTHCGWLVTNCWDVCSYWPQIRTQTHRRLAWAGSGLLGREIDPMTLVLLGVGRHCCHGNCFPPPIKYF